MIPWLHADLMKDYRARVVTLNVLCFNKKNRLKVPKLEVMFTLLSC